MRFGKISAVILVLLLTLFTGCAKAPAYSREVTDSSAHEAALREFFGESYHIPAAPASDFTYRHSEEAGGIMITDYLGSSEELKIPAEIDGHSVVGVDLRYCFRNFKALILPDCVRYLQLAGYDDIVEYLRGESVTIPWNLSYYYVQELGGWSINQYTGTSPVVRIPSQIRDPDTHELYDVVKVAFYDRCKDIEQLIMPDTVKYVFVRPYEDVLVYESELDALLTEAENVRGIYENIGVEKMNIPAAFFQERELAFAQSTLESVYIPDNFTSLSAGMFQDSPLLTKVRLSSDSITLGNNVFMGCERLTDIDISMATGIGSAAFSGCRSLESAELGPALVSIGSGAFSQCVSLREIHIPASVESIGSYAFHQCGRLSSLTVSGDNPVYLSEDGVLINRESGEAVN